MFRPGKNGRRPDGKAPGVFRTEEARVNTKVAEQAEVPTIPFDGDPTAVDPVTGLSPEDMAAVMRQAQEQQSEQQHRAA